MGSQQRIATEHVRVPSPMIGQYKLNSWHRYDALFVIWSFFSPTFVIRYLSLL